MAEARLLFIDDAGIVTVSILDADGLEDVSIVKTKTVTLTNAQIKALPSTAVEIIPAQGENTLIIPYFAVARMGWVADYTNIDATAYIQLDITGLFITPLLQNTLSGVSALLAGGGPDGTMVVFLMNHLAKSSITAAAPNVTPHYHQGATDSGWYDSDIVNKPITISAFNNGSDFQGGDPNNTLQIIVNYTVVTFS